jgi:hypothetical protein
MAAQKHELRKRVSQQFIAKIVGYNPAIKMTTFLILHFKTATRVLSGFGRNSTERGNFQQKLKIKSLMR